MEEKKLSARILVVGQSGSGKSSLVNVLAGKNVADVNDGANSCSTQFTVYPVQYNHVSYELIDTCDWRTPLDKFSESENNQENISKGIVSSNLEFSCVVFVMKKGRIEEKFEEIYNFIYKRILKEQVPALLYVAECEADDPMDSWRNQPINMNVIKKNYKFRDVVCGTGKCGGSFESVLEGLREQTKKNMWQAIEYHRRNEPRQTQIESYNTKQTTLCNDKDLDGQIMFIHGIGLMMDNDNEKKRIRILENKTTKRISCHSSHNNRSHQADLVCEAVAMPAPSEVKDRSRQNPQTQTFQSSNPTLCTTSLISTLWSTNDLFHESIKGACEDCYDDSKESLYTRKKECFDEQENNSSKNRNNANDHSNVLKSHDICEIVLKILPNTNEASLNTGEDLPYKSVKKKDVPSVSTASVFTTAKNAAGCSTSTTKGKVLSTVKSPTVEPSWHSSMLINSKRSAVCPVSIVSKQPPGSITKKKKADFYKNPKSERASSGRAFFRNFKQKLSLSRSKTPVKIISARRNSLPLAQTIDGRKNRKVSAENFPQSSPPTLAHGFMLPKSMNK